MISPYVRSYQPRDLEAVYDICVRTADAGGDARGMYASDRLMGDLFAAPYVILEPEHAHVVDDGEGNAVGYIVGTADTERFVRRYREEWIPRAGLPLPADPPVTPDDHMLALHYRPERMILPELAGHPAHLHIDLLPDWQGKGWGRRLMGAFVDGLRAAGVTGLHLSMLTSNVAARAFYDRLGFEELAVPGGGVVTYLVRDTSPAR
ncbi:GNAT family N-acetyltransferase [Nonomuraea sp. FMUSA5-5]|uniref:GNAT family N-acetyltransferase n=1 Tax=Nonomuraea composti TaxID=2720023 RepID=A0ABX1BR31_9ACTN|nr:GNAT family N-acetyltransferase [Nonomuraea sp. FMUSA5-5]NJP97213.1 GNAT family N-acetyltransferase [Nonomuraea sp. FMUSA5-5]